MNVSRLAINGGDREVAPFEDRWPRISDTERAHVVRLLDAGVVHQKATTLQVDFERQFASAVDARYCVSFSSGTAAIEAAFAAVGVNRGSTVVMPSYAYPAGAIAARALGADLTFVDCRRGALQCDENQVAATLALKPSALFVQHCWGNVCDMQFVTEVARRYKVPVVADCSHAFGVTWAGSRALVHADIGVYSLGPGKWVTGGEMGVMVCASAELHDRSVMYSGMNRPRADLIDAREWDDIESAFGIKSRPHAYALALAAGSLERVGEKLERSTQVGWRMAEAVRSCGWLMLEPVHADVRRVYWRLVAELVDGWNVKDVIRALEAEGVRVEPNEYAPPLHLRVVHQYESFADLLGRRSSQERNVVHLPVAERLAQRAITFAVPVAPSIAYEEAFARALQKIAANANTLRSAL